MNTVNNDDKTKGGEQTIKVIVGREPHAVPFELHRDILKSSGVLGGWPEDSEKASLKDCSLEPVDLYVKWLYYHLIETTADGKTPATTSARYLELAKAYRLGEVLEDQKFQDTVLDTLREMYISPAPNGRILPPASVVRYLYAKVQSSSSAIQRLVVDMYTHSTRAAFPDRLRFDLGQRLIAERDSSPQPKEPWCSYHLHEEEGDCYRKHLRLPKRLKPTPPKGNSS